MQRPVLELVHMEALVGGGRLSDARHRIDVGDGVR